MVAKQRVLAVALVLFMIAIPLVSVGATREQPLVWGAGLLLVVLAGLLPPVARYAARPPNG